MALIICAGGAARRLDGIDKVALRHRGRSLLAAVCASTRPGETCIVVGPETLRHRCGDLPPQLRFVEESPLGSGPARAVAAAVMSLRNEIDAGEFVQLAAADLLSPIDGLRHELEAALDTSPAAEVVVPVAGGRVQWLSACWRAEALLQVVDRGAPPADAALHSLFRQRRVVLLPADVPHDVDLPADLDLLRP